MYIFKQYLPQNLSTLKELLDIIREKHCRAVDIDVFWLETGNTFRQPQTVIFFLRYVVTDKKASYAYLEQCYKISLDTTNSEGLDIASKRHIYYAILRKQQLLKRFPMIQVSLQTMDGSTLMPLGESILKRNIEMNAEVIKPPELEE